MRVTGSIDKGYIYKAPGGRSYAIRSPGELTLSEYLHLTAIGGRPTRTEKERQDFTAAVFKLIAPEMPARALSQIPFFDQVEFVTRWHLEARQWVEDVQKLYQPQVTD